MLGTVLIDGVDLRSTGYVFDVKDIDGFQDGPELRYESVAALGRAGVGLGPPATVGPRYLTLVGLQNQVTRTVSTGMSALRLLKDLVYGGTKTITITDTAGNVRVVRDAVALSVQPARRLPTRHVLNLSVFDVAIRFLCPNPVWEVAEPRILAMPSATPTRYDLTLETAAVFPVIRIMGSVANPVITYRAADGSVVWQLGFTVTLAATNDWLELDFWRGRIWKYASGVQTAAESLLTTGQADFPRPFDPHDGDVATAQYPTLDVSAGTAMAMWWNGYL